jgi:hypothetical protein
MLPDESAASTWGIRHRGRAVQSRGLSKQGVVAVIQFRFLLLASTLAFASTAVAQQPAPAGASKIAPPSCEKPGDYPGRLASESQRRSWVRNANAYLDCLKKYAVEHQGIAKPLLDQAQPHIDAANAAIDEHNKAALAFKAEQDKQQN